MKNKSIILLIIVCLNVLLIGNIIHENIHKYDFRNIPKANEKIVYFNFDFIKDKSIASYSFIIDEQHFKEFNAIEVKSELRAVIGELIFIGLFLTLFIYFHRNEKPKKIIKR